MLEKILTGIKKTITAGLISVPLLSSCENIPDKYGSFMADIGIDAKGIVISDEGVPQAVREEANNPTIVNHYTGRRFDKNTIGTFSPREHLVMPCWNMGAKYVFPIIPIFVGGEFQFPLYGERTDDGRLGEDYSYANVLGTGADFVRYFYGIRYNTMIAKPVAGIHIEFPSRGDRFFMESSVKYERANLEYIKGIESYEDTHTIYKIAEQDLNIFDVDFKIGAALIGDRSKGGLIADKTRGLIFLHGGPLIIDKSGIDGWVVGVGAGLRF